MGIFGNCGNGHFGGLRRSAFFLKLSPMGICGINGDGHFWDLRRWTFVRLVATSFLGGSSDYVKPLNVSVVLMLTILQFV